MRIFVTNRLPEHTTIHWHGICLPNGMDGVGGLTQPHIEPGETYVYEFTLRQHGSFMYHPHADEMLQMAIGMMGMFIIHPKVTERAARRSRLLLHAACLGHRSGRLHAEAGHHDRVQHVDLQQPRVSRASTR